MSEGTPRRGGLEAQTPPRPEIFVETVRFLAATSSQVIITDHAQERMEERSITTTMLFRTLSKGRLDGALERGRKPGDWVGKIVAPAIGGREIGVVTVASSGTRLIIVTVEWEDAR